MKTAITQLKEAIQSRVNNPMTISIERDIFQRVLDVIDDSYLEAEKEQIMEAWKQGDVYGHNYYEKNYDEEEISQQYYQQTYN